jgi:hypothetical protein
VFSTDRRSALRLARAEAMTRLSELAERVLASPADDVLAERLATARLLYDQATTPAALAEVTALVAETVLVAEMVPAPPLRRSRRRSGRRSRRRDRRAVPSGIREAAKARRFRPTRPDVVAVAVRQDWWRKPSLVAGAFGLVLFGTATSEAGTDVVPWRITVAVTAAGFGCAVVWFLVRLRPVLAAYRTRRAAVEARLNEIAARVLHPVRAASPEAAHEQAEDAKRYVLLLHSYATEPLAEVERLLDIR